MEKFNQMSPINKNNFIFPIKHFKRLFKPLKKKNPQDYKFIMNLITKGADIKRTPKPPKNSHPNYPIKDKSLIEQITKKILHHLELGQFRGPYWLHQYPQSKYKIHTSPVSVKRKPSGKGLLLVDESQPIGDSINSAIS